MPGGYTAQVRGLSLTQSCAATGAAEHSLALGRVPAEALHELVFTLHVGPRGGRVDQVDIDYLAGNRPMTLRLDWQMVACGSSITDPTQCTR